MNTTKIICEYCKRPVEDDDKSSINGDKGLHNDCMTAYAKRTDKVEQLRCVFSTLIDECNGGDADVVREALVKALRFEHRTLQQVFMGVLKLSIRDYAGFISETDPRNRHARDWAQAVAALDNSDIRFPLV